MKNQFLLGFVIPFFFNHQVHAQLIHDYELNGSYLDEFGGNPMIPNGGYLSATEYVFDLDQGPNVSGVIDPEDYFIEMRFTPSAIEVWRKILDFKNRTSDNGLYIFLGTLQFWPYDPGAEVVFAPGVPVTVQFIRNGATKLMTGCVNGVWQWTIMDTYDDATFTGMNNIIQILIDDYQINTDDIAGSLDYFKISSSTGQTLDLELGDPVTSCGPYVIDPGVTGVEFYWSNGSTGPTLQVTESGTYSLAISSGCFATGFDSVEIFIEGVPESVDIGPPEVTICEGESYVISLDPSIGDYEWQDGSTDPEYTITTTGIYQVSFNDGCDITTDAISVEVTDLILPDITGVPGTVCENDDPILLLTNQEGITGTWSGEGVSNNIFDPSELNGTITLIFTPFSGQCAGEVTTDIFVETLISITISGVPDFLCQLNSPITLPDIQGGIPGNWSGIGVSNNNFNPTGLNGIIILTFTPDAGICALPETTSITVFENTYNISGIPASVCVNDPPIPLSPLQDGILGNWSGPGVSNNTFNPAAQNGMVTLTFTPNAGQCALSNTTIIQVNSPFIPNISGVPDAVCESDFALDLPTTQNGIDGNWSGPGVVNNTFNPSGQYGMITLFFTPIAGQCAQTVDWDITIEESVLPIISGLPSDLCQTDLPINLPIVQNGFTGVWTGPGVTNNIFNPNGWSGPITIFFNPDDGQCADDAEAVLQVEAAIIPLLSGVPNMLCETNSPINLSTIQDGIIGNWSGPGVLNNSFNPLGQNGNITLTFIPENGQCALTTTIAIAVSSAIPPIITGVPASLCQSDSSLFLPELQSGITGIWSGPNVNANSFSPSGISGNYALTFAPASGQCADTATIQIAVLTSPSFTNLIAVCDTAAESYTVTFEITGGDTASYMVNGMPVNGNIFTSASLLADSTHYAFMLDDANGCGPIYIQGSINCACVTNAGTMNFGGSPLKVCANSDFAVSFNEDANLDQDDLFGFVLHDNPGTQLGTIYAISNDTTFTFPPGIILGQTYYVSVIAGSNDGTGNIDLNDQCLSVAQGIPVIFYQPQASFSGGGEICPSACMTYTFNLAGEKPFELMYQVNANGMVTDHVLLTDTSTVSILICPMDYDLISGTIDMIPISLADAHCTVPLSSFPGSQTIVHPATTSMISDVLCPGQSLLVNGVVYDQSNPLGTEVMQDGLGCDSTVHISLSYYPPAVFDLNQTLCFGGSLTVNGTEYNESHPQGMEILPGDAINGCDSTIIIQLAFDSVVTADFSSTLCSGESLIIKGHTYDELNPTGTEVFPGESVLGCDSMLNVQLSFYPEAVSSLNPVLCPDELIIINGVVYDESHPSGIEVLPDASYFGCDSSIHIDLAFYPEAIGTITDTLHTGDSIIFHGTVYNQNNPIGTEIIPGASVAGCDSIIVITLFFRQALSVLIETVAPVCHGEASGEILVEDIIGGLSPYTLILDGGSSITATDFPFTLSGLSSGNHQLVILDATSAELVLELTVPEGPVLVVDAGIDLVIPYGEDAEFLAAASFPVSTWLWAPDDFLSCADCPDPQILNPDQDVAYTVVVIDQNGCLVSDEVAIKMVFENEMYMPTVFSPNGDGVNDTWRIYSSDQKAELVSLTILDRWGGIIYSCADKLLNDSNVEWDGRMKGREMESGVYVFVAVVKTNDGVSRQIKGDITLIR